MNFKPIDIREIGDFRIGQAQDEEAGTGITVIINEQGATGAVDVRGGGPATRETDLLKPENTVEKINAVVLSGGSAFGLEGSSGVMNYLREKNVGFGMGPYVVPIVVGASLFDLNCGNPKAYPDREMGYEAALASEKNEFTPGNYGAGTGATIGKMAGFDQAVKSGIGSAAFDLDGLKVGAVVAVNAVGNIYDASTKSLLAGIDPLLSRANTTIGVVLTNADLNKAQLTKVCQMAQDGLARAIEPVHTPFDGDAVFAMATNQIPADVTIVGILAAKAVEAAIHNAIRSAKPAYGYKNYQGQTAD